MECLCVQITEIGTGSFGGKEAELRHGPSGVRNHSKVQGKLPVPYSIHGCSEQLGHGSPGGFECPDGISM